METLTTENQITDTLQESIDLQNERLDGELIQVLECTIVQRGQDYLRDQGQLQWAKRRIATLSKENTELKQRRSGVGHQLRSEEKGLTACASHLENAFGALVTADKKFLDLQGRIADLMVEVSGLATAAQDRYNDNA